MSRSAPVVNGTPVTKLISLRFIDAQGDIRAVSVRALPANATNANIESFANAIEVMTNADLYQIVVQDEYTSVADSSNATNATVVSARANIVLSAKNAVGDLKNTFIPAPDSALFVPGTDTPLIDASFTAIFAAYLALLGTGFEIVSARFTERREINERVKI